MHSLLTEVGGALARRDAAWPRGFPSPVLLQRWAGQEVPGFQVTWWICCLVCFSIFNVKSHV